MKTTALLLRKIFWLALAALLSTLAANAAPKKLLVVTVTKGFRHSSIPTAERVLGQLAEKDGTFAVDYARTDDDLAHKMTPDALKNYDGVIFANTTGMLPLPDSDAFIAWIRSGKAFIGMHSASDTFHRYPPYIEMLGAEFQTHHTQETVDCLVQDPNHPATRGLGKVYTVHDEIYLFTNFHRDQVHALLGLDKHPNAPHHPGYYPICWCKRFGQGKVFYTELGHREDVWESAPYQQLILGGIRWALGEDYGDATPQCTQLRLSPREVRDGFIPLFNGVSLDGWKLRNPQSKVPWTAQNGWLVNDPATPHTGTDLVSDNKFRDFTVRYEYQIPKGSNSGFYLRGRYEIQILDDDDSQKLDVGGNGAIYSVKAPDQFVSKAPGQWQKVEATIRGNRITVFLNGVKIHDNVEVTRATGGQLDSDLDAPGPIMLQGDHGAVAFRNVRIKPLD